MRAYNFCAGPSALPEEVLEIAQKELKDWGHTGSSIMETSHRSPDFIKITRRSVRNLKKLLNIPDNYHVLFMQGGATGQFSIVPMNLLRGHDSADYVNSGIWSWKAIEEAERYCKVNVVADSSENDFTDIPELSTWNLNPNAGFLHYTTNETVNGIEFDWVPETNGVPIVADMSSNILSRPIDVEKFGLIYAGAQKNIGPSGITVVIVRDDLIGNSIQQTPGLFDYKNLADAESIFNTPPTFAWYLTDLVFEWLISIGGVEAIEKTNIRKANKLYHAIDKTGFYSNKVKPECRSRMNIPFTVGNSDIDHIFLEEAESNNLMNLNGFRSVGGMRASIYNSVKEEAVDVLVEFMSDFEKKFG